MGNMEAKKKFYADKKTLQITLNEAIYKEYKKKLIDDGITQQYMLETAINRYLQGIDHYKK